METTANQLAKELKNRLDEKMISWMQNQDWIIDFSVYLKKRFGHSKNWKTLVREDMEWAILWNTNFGSTPQGYDYWVRTNELYRKTYSNFQEEVEREFCNKYLKNNGLWKLTPTHKEDIYTLILKDMSFDTLNTFYEDNDLFRNDRVIEAYSIGKTTICSIDFALGGKDTLLKALNIIWSIRKKKTPRPSWKMLEWVRERPWHKELMLKALESKGGFPLEDISKHEFIICEYLMNDVQRNETSSFGRYRRLKNI